MSEKRKRGEGRLENLKMPAVFVIIFFQLILLEDARKSLINEYQKIDLLQDVIAFQSEIDPKVIDFIQDYHEDSLLVLLPDEEIEMNRLFIGELMKLFILMNEKQAMFYFDQVNEFKSVDGHITYRTLLDSQIFQRVDDEISAVISLEKERILTSSGIILLSFLIQIALGWGKLDFRFLAQRNRLEDETELDDQGDYIYGLDPQEAEEYEGDEVEDAYYLESSDDKKYK